MMLGSVNAALMHALETIPLNSTDQNIPPAVAQPLLVVASLLVSSYSYLRECIGPHAWGSSFDYLTWCSYPRLGVVTLTG